MKASDVLSGLLSARQSILKTLARQAGAFGLEAAFPWPELCEVVFRADPQRFAMPGYPQLLDTKRISVEVCKMCFDRNRRHIEPDLERISTGLFRLTPHGLDTGLELLASQAKGAA